MHETLVVLTLQARHAALQVDDQIKDAVSSLLKHTLAAHKGLCTQPGVSCPSSIAAAAVAAAEANGALPPLTGEQRQAFQDALQVIASGMILDSSTTKAPSVVEDAAGNPLWHQSFACLSCACMGLPRVTRSVIVN